MAIGSPSQAYMLKVYNYMATGILLTGIVALLTFKMSVVTNDAGSIVGLTSMGNAIYMSGLKWLVMLAPLGIVFYMSFGINKMSASKAQTTFWVFAGLMGLSLSSILLVYTGMSVTRVFFICSATFGGGRHCAEVGVGGAPGRQGGGADGGAC